MRMTTAMMIAGVLAATCGSAAAGSLIGGGTPDAQNGAQGRNQPSSFRGRDPQLYSGRSVGFGRDHGYRGDNGYGRYGYGRERRFLPY